MAAYTMFRSDLIGKPSVIYILVHPITREVRYVGATTQEPDRRMREHICDARRRAKSYVHRWILSLLDAGLKPEMIVVQKVPATGDRVKAERKWIAIYRKQGARLANLTEGGDGCPGYKMSDEGRAYISACRKASGISKENRAKMQAAAKLVFESEEYRAKISGRSGALNPRFGTKHTPETKAKMSAKRKANPSGSAGKAGGQNAWARAVIIGDTIYATVTIAAKELGLTQPAISQRLRKGTAFYARE
jgi:group I intron endonuclease